MKPNLLAVYGILKRNYELDLSEYGGKFIGEGVIKDAVLFGIGRKWDHESHPNDGVQFHGVGLKLNSPREGVQDAQVELWEIPDTLDAWLDQIEQNGFCYTRKVVPVQIAQPWAPDGEDTVYKTVNAWV